LEAYVAIRPIMFAGVLAGLTLFAAACGDDDDTAPPETAEPGATVENSSAATTAPAAPASDAPVRIVSLAPTHTEILFAIGAGEQVIAVDDQSNYPPEAEAVRTDLSGFEPNVEAIAGYEPDLVVTSEDNVTSQLESLGITVWVGPAATSLDDTYAQIEQLGELTGHVAEASALVAQMQTDIEAITASVPPMDPPLSVYHELGTDGFSANSSTFIGQVYSELGLRNIADLAEGDTGGYPQLNAEAIISSNPDLIFLADTKCCGESAETISARPGWSDITAVANGHVFPMDDDVASRWGPRVVEYLRQVADAVAHAATVSTGG
jgi:iron complex transport system substrate-binding protein